MKLRTAVMATSLLTLPVAARAAEDLPGTGKRLKLMHIQVSGETRAALKKALAGSDPFVQKYAARALGNAGKDAAGAVDALVKALSDKDAEVRREAVWSLALVGKAAGSAAGALESAAKKDSNYVVRYAAGRAVARVRGQ